MTEADVAVRLARAEVVARTFALTRQYLATQDVVKDSAGLATVARVDDSHEPGAYHVYFEMRDGPYHCVVVVKPNGTGVLEVSWIYVQPAIRVYLAIRSTHVAPDEITRRTRLEPTRIRLKGTPIGIRQGGRPLNEHCWDLEARPDFPVGPMRSLPPSSRKSSRLWTRSPTCGPNARPVWSWSSKGGPETASSAASTWTPVRCGSWQLPE